MTKAVIAAGHIITLTDNIADDISDWLPHEHQCDDDQCDIGVALREGFPIAAAAMLMKQQDCPILDAILWSYQVTIDELTMVDGSEWDRWLDFVRDHGSRCMLCERYNYSRDLVAVTHCRYCGSRLLESRAHVEA